MSFCRTTILRVETKQIYTQRYILNTSINNTTHSISTMFYVHDWYTIMPYLNVRYIYFLCLQMNWIPRDIKCCIFLYIVYIWKILRPIGACHCNIVVAILKTNGLNVPNISLFCLLPNIERSPSNYSC